MAENKTSIDYTLEELPGIMKDFSPDEAKIFTKGDNRKGIKEVMQNLFGNVKRKRRHFMGGLISLAAPKGKKRKEYDYRVFIEARKDGRYFVLYVNGEEVKKSKKLFKPSLEVINFINSKKK